MHGLRREPAVAGGAPRRPRLRGAVLRRSATTSTRSSPSACATRSAWSCRPSTTSCRASRRCAIASTRSACASPSRRSTPRSPATTSARPAGAARGRRRRGDDLAAATSCRRRRASRSSSSRAAGAAACRRSRRATRTSWRSSCRYVAAPVVQEYLDGPEFTLDVLCDFDGRPLSVVPRERVVIRAGVIDRGRHGQRSAADRTWRSRAREVFAFAGPVNIQCRMVDGGPMVFEINPRFSGGIPLTIAAGADFPAMLVDLALGRRVAPAIGRFRGDCGCRATKRRCSSNRPSWPWNAVCMDRGGERGSHDQSVPRQPARPPSPVTTPWSSSRPAWDRAACRARCWRRIGGRSILAHCIERLGRPRRRGDRRDHDPPRRRGGGRRGRAPPASRVVRGPVDDVLGRFVGALADWNGPYVIPRHRRQPVGRHRRPRPRCSRCSTPAPTTAVEEGLPVGAAVEGDARRARCARPATLAAIGLRPRARDAVHPRISGDASKVLSARRRRPSCYRPHPAADRRHARRTLQFVRSLVEQAGAASASCRCARSSRWPIAPRAGPASHDSGDASGRVDAWSSTTTRSPGSKPAGHRDLDDERREAAGA